ncbi:MAG: alpha-ketoglutarate-dependent dioxygenase AlkB [Myxococcota bacterium]
MSSNLADARVTLPGGDALLIEGFIELSDADSYLERLLADVAWEQHQIQILGRRIATPRLSAWYGDPGARYCYSGLMLEPLGWLPAIAELKAQIESRSSGWLPSTAYFNNSSNSDNCNYNSALLNLYRNGSDSMGWHSDDEPELGDRPVIASLSLGAARRFRLKHRSRPDLDPVALTLSHGSLLIMYGDTQKNWKHALPKSSSVCGPRINLTFRFVQPR